MLDFGWQEFLLIAIVTVLVVGPKELPRVFRTITGVMKKARSLAGEFHSAMDDLAKETELDDFKKEVNKVKDGSSDWVKEIDPTGEMDKSIKEVKAGVDGARDAVNTEARAGDAAGKAAAKTKVDPVHTTPTPTLPTAGGTAAKKATPKKSATKKAASKKATAKKATAKKVAAKKAPAQSTASKAAPATPTPATPTPAKPTPAKTTRAKKATARKSPAAKPATAKSPDKTT